LSKVRESMKKVVEKDIFDDRILNIKQESLLKPGEDDTCLIINCHHSRKLELEKKKLEDSEETIKTLRNQIKHYEDKIEDALLKMREHPDSPALTKEQLLEEIKKIKDSQELDILKRKHTETKEQLAQVITEKEVIKERFDSYRRDQEQILTTYQADAEIQKALQEIRVRREKLDVINQRVSEKELKLMQHQKNINGFIDFYNNELVPKHNAMLKHIAELENQVMLKKKELNRLSSVPPVKIVPEKEPENKGGKVAKGKRGLRFLNLFGGSERPRTA